MNVNMDIGLLITIILSAGSAIGSFLMMRSDVTQVKNRLKKVGEDMDDSSNAAAIAIEKHISETSKRFADRIEECRKRIDDITIKLEKMNDKLESEISNKVSDIKHDTEKKVKLIFEKLDNVRDKTEYVEREMSKVELRVTSNEQNLKQLENLNGIGIDIGMLKKELEHLMKVVDKMEDRVEKIIEKIIISD